MIVILAVALIVVGPDKLPDMARSLAKGVFELKKTLNQVKESLADEDNLIGSVQSDLRKTADELKGDLIEMDSFSGYEPGTPRDFEEGSPPGVIDMGDAPPEFESVDVATGQDASEQETTGTSAEAGEEPSHPAKPEA